MRTVEAIPARPLECIRETIDNYDVTHHQGFSGEIISTSHYRIMRRYNSIGELIDSFIIPDDGLTVKIVWQSIDLGL